METGLHRQSRAARRCPARNSRWSALPHGTVHGAVAPDRERHHGGRRVRTRGSRSPVRHFSCHLLPEQIGIVARIGRQMASRSRIRRRPSQLMPIIGLTSAWPWRCKAGSDDRFASRDMELTLDSLRRWLAAVCGFAAGWRPARVPLLWLRLHFFGGGSGTSDRCRWPPDSPVRYALVSGNGLDYAYDHRRYRPRRCCRPSSLAPLAAE